jgi:hypothetical protein
MIPAMRSHSVRTILGALALPAAALGLGCGAAGASTASTTSVAASAAATSDPAATAAVSSAPTAHAAAVCKVPNSVAVNTGSTRKGPSYVISLSASGTSCATGLKVVKDFHLCQLSHGGPLGTCSSTIDGVKCTEKRLTGNPSGEVLSATTCKSSSGKIVVGFKYGQFPHPPA